MNEIWKEIPGYESLYEVSDLGRIRSLKTGKLRLLTFTKPKSRRQLPYVTIRLCKNAKHKSYTVHRLVMLTFEGNRPNGCSVIMHLDDDPTNNAYSNLKYGTQTENQKQCYAKKRRLVNVEKLREYSQKGGDIKKKKVKRIDPITNEEKIYDAVRFAARALNLSCGTLTNACKGRRKTCGGYKWEYA